MSISAIISAWFERRCSLQRFQPTSAQRSSRTVQRTNGVQHKHYVVPLRSISMETTTELATGQASYAVHVDVDGSEIPPHPGPNWTRFVCISDTHSREYRIPSGDVLLHAGDLTSWGQPLQLAKTIEWLRSLEHPVKIIVAGNHDLFLDRQWGKDGSEWGPFDAKVIEHARTYVRGHQSFGLYYLEHESLQFTSPTGRVWKVYGSPAAPFHAHGAFQYESVAEARAIYDNISNDTEILLTHTPPYGILDVTTKGELAGCKTLSSRLNDLKDCRLHVFGHIHEAAGVCIDTVQDTELPRVSVNAAIERSESAIVVDLRN